MQAGEKISYQGSQVCLFPMDYVYCTQVSGPGSYSHCCGHPADWVGSYNEYPCYAPFDCHLVYSDSVGNTRAYTSDAPVWTPQGLQYVTVSFTHDYTPPAATSYSQGDLIYHTGEAGGAIGDHVHIDQSNIANAQLVNYGVQCQYHIETGTWCFALDGSQPPEDIFYLSGSETFVTDQGMGLETWDKPPEPIGSKAKYAILFLAKKRKEERDHGRIKRYSGII